MKKSLDELFENTFIEGLRSIDPACPGDEEPVQDTDTPISELTEIEAKVWNQRQQTVDIAMRLARQQRVQDADTLTQLKYQSELFDTLLWALILSRIQVTDCVGIRQGGVIVIREPSKKEQMFRMLQEIAE